MDLLSMSGGPSPSDFKTMIDIENPLPECPGTPNCIRTTLYVDRPHSFIFKAALNAVRDMEPFKLKASADQNRIDTVFKVLFFKDDMSLKTEEKNNGTLIHIRSASRVGYSDLGVNSRRVKKFMKKLRKSLQQP